MHWNETVFKQSEIKWKQPKFKYADDDNIDLILIVPISNLMREQARRSFTIGVFEVLKLIGSVPADGSVDLNKLLKEKFIEWGMHQSAIDSIKTEEK